MKRSFTLLSQASLLMTLLLAPQDIQAVVKRLDMHSPHLDKNYQPILNIGHQREGADMQRSEAERSLSLRQVPARAQAQDGQRFTHQLDGVRHRGQNTDSYTLYTYDAKGRVATKEENGNKYLYTYDEQNRVIKEIIRYYSGENTIRSEHISEYVYINGNQHTILSEDRYRGDDGLLKTSSKSIFEYNEDGIETKYLRYEKDSLCEGFKTTDTKDDNGNTVNRITTRYNAEQKQWTDESKTEFIHNSKGLVTANMHYTWTDNAWVNTSVNEYIYDDSDRTQTGNEYSIDETGEKNLCYKTDYAYTADKGYTYESYSMRNGKWVLAQKGINNPTHYLWEYYNPDTNTQYQYPNLWEKADLVLDAIHCESYDLQVSDINYRIEEGNIFISFPKNNGSGFKAELVFNTSLDKVINPNAGHTLSCIHENSQTCYTDMKVRAIGAEQAVVDVNSGRCNAGTRAVQKWTEGQSEGSVEGQKYQVIITVDSNYYYYDNMIIALTDIVLNEDGLEMAEVAESNLQGRNETHYNEQGKIIDNYWYSNWGSPNISHTTYEYNEDGDLTELFTYSYSNEYRKTEIETYHYDTDGDGRYVKGCSSSHPIISVDKYYSNSFYYDNSYWQWYNNSYTDYYEYSECPFVINGLKYTVDYDTHEAKLIGYETAPGASLVIPATIQIEGENYTVSAISEGEYDEDTEIRHLDIPATINEILDHPFYNCEIESIIIRATEVPASEYELFSSLTQRHAILYVPAESWHAYAYSNGFGWFINIKKDAATVSAVSAQKAYTMLDSRTMNYTVYDPVTNSLKNIASANDIDEGNPNHTWMAFKTNSGNYLYNLGAKKYAHVTSEGQMVLSSSAVRNNFEQGTEGIVIGDDTTKQWNFIENGSLGIDPAVIDNVTSIDNLEIEDSATEVYNYAGQRTNAQQSGFLIIKTQSGASHKIAK